MAKAAGIFLIVAAVMGASAPARAAMVAGGTHTLPGGHGPPDVRDLYICRVLPRYGGGFCTSPPYAPVGKRCTCEGPKGPRPGVVEHR
jgi:hypothetical protein